MGYKRRPDSPELQRAKGLHYLLRYFSGESVLHIAAETGHDRKTIRKLMKTAAAQMVDAAQARVLDEVFPLALKVYQAYLQQQLDAAKEGKPIDLGAVERLLKSFYITDAPQLKKELVGSSEGDNEEEVTLQGFVAKHILRPTPTPKFIDAKVSHESDEAVDSEASGTRALPQPTDPGHDQGNLRGVDQVQRDGVRGSGLDGTTSDVGPSEAD